MDRPAVYVGTTDEGTARGVCNGCRNAVHDAHPLTAPETDSARVRADHLEHRPEYDAQWREDIVAHVTSEGIPYCYTCHDWHFYADGHSGSGFGWTDPDEAKSEES